jgi:hypothetical protein
MRMRVRLSPSEINALATVNAGAGTCREQRKPHPRIVTEPVYQHERRLASAGLEVVNANAIHICEKCLVVSAIPAGADSAAEIKIEIAVDFPSPQRL